MQGFLEKYKQKIIIILILLKIWGYTMLKTCTLLIHFVHHGAGQTVMDTHIQPLKDGHNNTLPDNKKGRKG